MSLLITGGSGFLGKYLLKEVISNGYEYKLLGRTLLNNIAIENQFLVDDFTNIKDLDVLFCGIDAVIHCAARVHVMSDESFNPLVEFRKVNTHGTLNLAEKAANAGVKRFIFISSIKVNGESTNVDYPFRSDDSFIPTDPYGLSKYEAEIGLRKIAEQTGMEIVIIRPPLIYGSGVKANFASLLKLVSKGLPLPFGCITDNKRSLVSVKNLVDLIVTCIDHPKAVNQVFLVSDDHDVSTALIVKYMSQALGKSNRLLPVPLWCYRLVGKLMGKTDVVNRLVGSLQVDISHTKGTLGWIPPQKLEDGFKETAEAFILNQNK